MRILFQGDSITDCGRDRNSFYDLGNGYVKKVKEQLTDCEILNRGISGNKVSDLNVRWSGDCINLTPDILSILIGVNDVWHLLDEGRECSDSKFTLEYISILERVKNELPGTKIIILEPFLLKVGAGNQRFREFLNRKIDIVRDIAKDFADAFIPLDGIFQSYRPQKKDEFLIPDGVHPSNLGHAIIADEIVACLKNDIIPRIE